MIIKVNLLYSSCIFHDASGEGSTQNLDDLMREVMVPPVLLRRQRFPSFSWDMNLKPPSAHLHPPARPPASLLLTSHSLGLLNSFFSVDFRNSSRLTSRSLFVSTFKNP